MKKDNNILDDQFRSKLENFEQIPPPEVWNKVQQSIRTGKKKFLYYRLSGVAAVLLIALFIGWQQLREMDNDPNLELSENLQEESLPEGNKHDTDSTPNVQTIVSNDDLNNSGVVRDSEEKISQLAFVNSSGEKTEEKIETSLLERIDESIVELQSILTNKIESNPSQDRNSLYQSSYISTLSEADRQLIADNLIWMEMEETKSERKSWKLGVDIAPSYSVYQTSQDKAYASNMSYPGSTDEVNLQGGFTVEYELNDRWSVQTGVYYNRNSQTSKNYTSYNNLSYSVADADLLYTTAISRVGAVREMNSVVGVIEINNLPREVDYIITAEKTLRDNDISISKSDFEQQFEYIEMPLILNYRLVDSTIDIQLKGGLNAGVLVGNVVLMENNSQKYEVGKTLGMRKVNYSTSLGVGFGYQLSERLLLKFEPRVKYYLQSLNKNSSIVYKPSVFSFYTGISYEF